MSKPPISHKNLVAGLITAQQNEDRFVDAACQLMRQTLLQNMSRARAFALMAGGFEATLGATVVFNFAPGTGGVEVRCGGQIVHDGVAAHWEETQSSRL